jgi:uncharacterized damage-inducible protein DinB
MQRPYQFTVNPVILAVSYLERRSMTKETFTLLAKYNRIANEKMDAVIKTLSDDEWNRELGGYFKSIRGLASHIYVTDFTYLKRFGNYREFAVLKDPLFKESYTFKDVLFPGKDEYLAKRPELDKLISSVIEEITEDDLKHTLKYSNAAGKNFEFIFSGVLMQVFNHQSHHRGMISLCLELLGKDNDFSSVMAVL